MKHHRFWLFAVVLVAGLAFAPAAQAVSISFDDVPEYVGDPGFFADGSYAGSGEGVFRFSGGDPLYYEDTWVSPFVYYSAPHSLAAGFIGWDSLIRLDSHTMPFASVSALFSFDAFINFPAPLFLAGFDESGNQLYEVSFLASDVSWYPISLSYPAGMSYVMFYDPLGNPFNIDDVNFALVPEPGVLALLGLGMACLGVRVRRRKA